jgi:hypothetical protein
LHFHFGSTYAVASRDLHGNPPATAATPPMQSSRLRSQNVSPPYAGWAQMPSTGKQHAIEGTVIHRIRPTAPGEIILLQQKTRWWPPLFHAPRRIEEICAQAE